jgi:hypothetical protein
MIARTGAKLERGRNVRLFKERIIVHNLFSARPGGEKVEDVLDPDAQAPDARASPALGGIDCNARAISLIAFPSQPDSPPIEHTMPGAKLNWIQPFGAGET